MEAIPFGVTYYFGATLSIGNHCFYWESFFSVGAVFFSGSSSFYWEVFLLVEIIPFSGSRFCNRKPFRLVWVIPLNGNLSEEAILVRTDAILICHCFSKPYRGIVTVLGITKSLSFKLICKFSIPMYMCYSFTELLPLVRAKVSLRILTAN